MNDRGFVLHGDFILHGDSVWYRTGTMVDIPTRNKVAAFDLENTLIWSEAGLPYTRTAYDWVPTTNYSKLCDAIGSLIQDGWTIVIFANQLENNPRHTGTALERINNFIEVVKIEQPQFNPFVYVAIRDDRNRKPRIGMWNLFYSHTGIIPSPASFYCGDAIGPKDPNPLYQWSTHDTDFAKAIGLAIYTPDEILGVFEPTIDISAYNILFIMAADESQYRDFIAELSEDYEVGRLPNLRAIINRNKKAVIIGEFASTTGRNRLRDYLSVNQLETAAFLLFTRPVKPFAANWNRIVNVVKGYANALNIHIRQHDYQRITVGDLMVPLIRMN